LINAVANATGLKNKPPATIKNGRAVVCSRVMSKFPFGLEYGAHSA
jgi:hypothetical protein